MEQILAFVLGASAVVFVWTVVVAFRTSKLAKQNEKDIQNLGDWISRNDESAHRRIDQEIERVNNLHSDSISFTNSRADKLDSKIENNKHLLKG